MADNPHRHRGDPVKYDHDRMFPGAKIHNDGGAHHDKRGQYIRMAVSGELSQASGLNVDFQLQRWTQAQDHYKTETRNPLGGRWLRNG